MIFDTTIAPAVSDTNVGKVSADNVAGKVELFHISAG